MRIVEGIWCDTMINVTPDSRLIPVSSDSMCLMETESSPENGSSQSKMLGFLIIARRQGDASEHPPGKFAGKQANRVRYAHRREARVDFLGDFAGVRRPFSRRGGAGCQKRCRSPEGLLPETAFQACGALH